MADTPHSHLEIHSLADGGYVVREGRYDRDYDGREEFRFMIRSERAAFSSLGDALKWMSKQMINKEPALK